MGQVRADDACPVSNPMFSSGQVVLFLDSGVIL